MRGKHFNHIQLSYTRICLYKWMKTTQPCQKTLQTHRSDFIYTTILSVFWYGGQPAPSSLHFAVSRSQHSMPSVDGKKQYGLVFPHLRMKSWERWRPKVLLPPSLLFGQESWEERLSGVSKALCRLGCCVVSKDVSLELFVCKTAEEGEDLPQMPSYLCSLLTVLLCLICHP